MFNFCLIQVKWSVLEEPKTKFPFLALVGCNIPSDDERLLAFNSTQVFLLDYKTRSQNCRTSFQITQPLPEGVGIRVGPGTDIHQLAFCIHYHFHEPGLFPASTENSSISLQLEPLTSSKIQREAFFGQLTARHVERYPDGMRLLQSHVLHQETSIQLISASIHLHAYGYLPYYSYLMLSHGDELITYFNTTAQGTIEFHGKEADMHISENDTLRWGCVFNTNVLEDYRYKSLHENLIAAEILILHLFPFFSFQR